MKKLILCAALLLGAMSVSAKSDPAANDTIPVQPNKEYKLVTDETTNTKGQKTTKYYIVYDGELIPTSKRVAETMRLCEKHGAKCALAVVISKKNNHKRIILN